MSATINQKAYLQKYLGRPSGDKKKKKKKIVKGQGFKIIDDDIDFSKLRALDGDELDILDEGEDAPQIAGIIDERPDEIKKLEQFKTTSKWRVINQDDGFISKLQVEEIKKDFKEIEKENELIFGKMYSDSEDDKKIDSDPSPPRKRDKDSEIRNKSSKKSQNNSDNDFSPPRKRISNSPSMKSKSNDKNNDSDLSPPRKKTQDTREKPRKPSRWEKMDNNDRSSSSETSIRKEQRNGQSTKRKKTLKKSNSSDVSPPRRSQNSERNHNNSDRSPPRKSRRDSPVRKNYKNSDTDLSPPRKRKVSPNKRNLNDNRSRHNSLKDRNKNHSNQSPNRYYIKSQDSDSDMSPPRKPHNNKRDEDRRNYKRNDDSPPPSNSKMAKTLEGKKAGLQDAYQLRQENEAFRKREEETFNKMTDEVSGRNAKTVSRKGKRETSEERQKQKDKAERQKEIDEKYKRWNKGIKQIEDQEAKIQNYLHEASKPLARHRNDRDLEDSLKQVERQGDPMLQYMRDKKVERGELAPERPKYKGNYPPNRFNIRPGYRWDGVDRSNGYEKKYFDQQSKRKAQEEEAYKWSTEDL